MCQRTYAIVISDGNFYDFIRAKYNVYRVFPGVQRPERGVEHPPHIAPKLKKE